MSYRLLRKGNLVNLLQTSKQDCTWLAEDLENTMPGQTPAKKQAVAQFTKDMVETLLEYFDAYADDDNAVKVHVRHDGLWLSNPGTGGWQFLGLAVLPHCRH